MGVAIMTRQDIARREVVGADQEILDWVLYDTLTILTGGTQTAFRFFQQAFGQAAITKEITNMEIPGQLPARHLFVLQKVVLQPVLNVLTGVVAAFTDALAVTHRGWSSLNIGRASYLESPVQMLIGGAFTGFGGVGAEVYAASRTVINGELEYSPVIPATFSFSLSIDYPVAPTLAANQQLRCLLVGKMIRPRQG